MDMDSQLCCLSTVSTHSPGCSSICRAIQSPSKCAYHQPRAPSPAAPGRTKGSRKNRWSVEITDLRGAAAVAAAVRAACSVTEVGARSPSSKVESFLLFLAFHA